MAISADIPIEHVCQENQEWDRVPSTVFIGCMKRRINAFYGYFCDFLQIKGARFNKSFEETAVRILVHNYALPIAIITPRCLLK